MISQRERDSQLVEKTARHPGGEEFGFLTEEREFERRSLEAESESQRQLEGCTRGEARPERKGRVDATDEAAARDGELRDCCGKAGPFGFDGGGFEWRVEIDARATTACIRGEFDAPPGAPARHGGPEIDRHGHRQSTGVIGVIADQVDAPRSVGRNHDVVG